MKVLVLNCGSSSIKYQLFVMPARTVLAKGMIERIGSREAALVQQDHHGAALGLVADGLLRLPDRLRRSPALEVFLEPQDRKIERGHFEPSACMAGLFCGVGVSIGQGMAEMARLRVRMSLNDGDPSGHRVPRERLACTCADRQRLSLHPRSVNASRTRNHGVTLHSALNPQPLVVCTERCRRCTESERGTGAGGTNGWGE